MGRKLTTAEALARVPQQEPFRFVDELLELSEERAVGRYRWRPEADFYRGHFPGNPVTPGVLLIESMAQCGVVPIALQRLYAEFDDAEAATYQTFFTDAQVDFSGVVRPGDVVTTESRVLFYRRRKIKVEATMSGADGRIVCSGQLSGMGVAR
ncbi:MAG: beta-hydroxyacyl-ACP dehydratase [Deltaproteobacteria bacterium]|nr:beta-hydroxyacyl-ACP dehydratase [Deltaproteobacteria bacterium]